MDEVFTKCMMNTFVCSARCCSFFIDMAIQKYLSC